MRISDWSSDVCSSDLAGQRPAAGNAAADLVDEGLEALLAQRAGGVLVRLRERRRHGEVVADEEGQALQQDLLVALNPVELPADPVEADLEAFIEIGRASGKERVGQ